MMQNKCSFYLNIKIIFNIGLSLMLITLLGCGENSTAAPTGESKLGIVEGERMVFAPMASYPFPSTLMNVTLMAVDQQGQQFFQYVFEPNHCQMPIGNEFSCTATVHLNGSVMYYNRLEGMWQPSLLFQASRSQHGNKFGYAMSLSTDGKVLAVSATTDSSLNENNQVCIGINPADCEPSKANVNAVNSTEGYQTGAVYVYRQDDTGWKEEAFIKPASSNSSSFNTFFGSTVNLSSDGSYLVVGEQQNSINQAGIISGQANITAFYQNTSSSPISGAVSIYHFNSTSSLWEHQTVISQNSMFKGFGSHTFLNKAGNKLSVLNADKLLHTYLRTGSTWSEATGIFPNLPSLRVSISDDGLRMVVGDPHYNQNCTGIMTAANKGSQCTTTGDDKTGAVHYYTFNEDDQEWQLTHFFRPDTLRLNHEYGRNVAISADGQRIMVSEMKQETCLGRMKTPSECQNDSSVLLSTPGDSGAVYVYTEENGSWTLTYYLAEHQISSANQEFGLRGLKFMDDRALIMTESTAAMDCKGVYINLDVQDCDYSQSDQNNLIYSIQL
jgi:hypothetical protein